VTKKACFCYAISYCEKTVLDNIITSMDSYEESGYDLSSHTKVSLLTSPQPPHLGVEKLKNLRRVKLDFTHSNDNILA